MKIKLKFKCGCEVSDCILHWEEGTRDGKPCMENPYVEVGEGCAGCVWNEGRDYGYWDALL